jgi:hypothetical protein
MILTTQLIKEIGLKSFILEGMLTFRTNVIMMCLSIADLFSLKKKVKAKLIYVLFDYVPTLF